MADHLEINVSVVPVEELTDEQGNTVRTISGEVGRTLGGSGTSVDLANYSGTLVGQGYKDGAVGYLDTTFGDAAVPTDVTDVDGYDAIFIRNTGFKYSSATALGASTTDCIMVAIEQIAWSTGAQAGFCTEGDAGEIHYYEVGWLKPGQAMILPVGASKYSMSKMGALAGDLTRLDQAGSGTQGTAHVVVKTFQSDGSEATDGNAVEFLCVT